jgi:hypothetical protein
MIKAKLKEENVVKISITDKRTGEEVDGYMKILEEVGLEELIKLEKIMAKKRRMESN